MFSAVFRQRCNARQSCNFASIQLAEFRAFGEHRQAGDRANAGNATQQIILGSPNVGCTQALGQVIVKIGDALVQPSDMCLQALHLYF